MKNPGWGTRQNFQGEARVLRTETTKATFEPWGVRAGTWVSLYGFSEGSMEDEC